MRAARIGTSRRREMNSNSKRSYSGVLLLHGATVMLCKRREDSPVGGYWSVPCGEIEKGESAFRAAQRELEEETEIIIDEAMLEYITAFKAHDGGRFNLYLYRSSAFLSPVLDEEHTEWGYFRLDRIEDVYINKRLMDALLFLREKFLNCE